MPQALSEIRNAVNHHQNRREDHVNVKPSGHAPDACGRVRRRIKPLYKPGCIEVIALSPHGKGCGDSDKSDDDIEFVRHIRKDPKANIAAQYKKVKGHSNSHSNRGDAGDGETLIISQTHGVRALQDLPHPGPLCAVHSFGDENEAEKFSINCSCVSCQVKASSCTHWDHHARLPLSQSQSLD